MQKSSNCEEFIKHTTSEFTEFDKASCNDIVDKLVMYFLHWSVSMYVDVFCGKPETEEFHQEQLRFMNEEFRNKDNLVVSLLNQLNNISKQSK